MTRSLFLALLFALSCTFKAKNESASYHAGFATLHIVDRSRIYRPGTDTADYLHFRPIDLDTWYPAAPRANDTPILVQDLLGLLEQRANYYAASNVGNGFAGKLAQLFCEGFQCSDSTRLLRFKTNSFKNAPSLNGKFPLIIYMTAFNGMSYENFSLFEALAKKGFIVASISSIGRYPGDMTMKLEDLSEQVKDAIAVMKTLKQNEKIDFENVGVAGYSWGGLAGAMLAGKIQGVKCLVSLEGSEFHHYGSAKEEDADFDRIRNSEGFKDLHLSVPYLRLQSSPSGEQEKTDSVYPFSANHLNNALVFTIDSARHEDFNCFSLIVKESGNCKINQRYTSALNLTVSFLEDHLKNQNNFFKTVAGSKNVIKNK